MAINGERAVVISVAALAVIAYCEILQTVDAAQTNRELRSMAHDTRRANGYLVRAAHQRVHRV